MEKNLAVTESSYSLSKHRHCTIPTYIGSSALIIICMPLLFVRMLAIIKLAFTCIVALGFSFVFLYSHRPLFTGNSLAGSSTPNDLYMIGSSVIFVVLVYAHGRLLDRLERIVSLWQRSCSNQHVSTTTISQHCRRLLNNLFPEPALKCLVDSAIPIDSYSENQDNVAVIVINLENLPQASSLERRLNSGKTVDSFRILGQLICQIDELLLEGRFKDLIKVRSIGSTYVAAVGLYAIDNNSIHETVVSHRLSVAIDFVLAVRQMSVMTNSSLGSDITVHSGISVGTVTCAVTACRGLYFDIFSNTVKTALQMARTCKPDYVQVSETVYTYTRYLYRYYSRKRMVVEPIGEFFAYRLIGTRAMYRNGAMGPLIGGGLTRQGSRESGVSLLSQATSIWSQSAGPVQRQQKMPFATSDQAVIRGKHSVVQEETTFNDNIPMVTSCGDISCHYASAIVNNNCQSVGNMSHQSTGAYQYASAYVPTFGNTRNINASFLSAVPEMETSAHDMSGGANKDHPLPQITPMTPPIPQISQSKLVQSDNSQNEYEEISCQLRTLSPLLNVVQDSSNLESSHYDNNSQVCFSENHSMTLTFCLGKYWWR